MIIKLNDQKIDIPAGMTVIDGGKGFDYLQYRGVDVYAHDDDDLFSVAFGDNCDDWVIVTSPADAITEINKSLDRPVS